MMKDANISQKADKYDTLRFTAWAKDILFYGSYGKYIG